MQRIVGYTSDEVCREIYINGNQPLPGKSAGDAIVISASVGINAVNLTDDVSIIQDALNRVSLADGGASPPLNVDGACGPKTKNAIQQFQLKQFGWSGADGKINPGGQTITRLNELLGKPGLSATAASFEPTPGATENSIFKGVMTGGLMLAQKWIRAAQANLDLALIYVNAPKSPPGALPVFGREERMRLANRYFRIDDFPAAERFEKLQRVRLVFTTMQQVFERPGGLWGEKAFEIDSTGIRYKQTPTVLAWTDWGGFFKSGESNQLQKGMRADSIFFIREHAIRFINMKYAAYVIVHELAHFCGDPWSPKDAHRYWVIEDFDAYGEPERPKVAKLPLNQRVRHADSYAIFAGTVAN